jgi:hypothetical protein
MMNIETLAASWLASKQQEENAIKNRRDIEDYILELGNIPADIDGTKTLDFAGLEVKIIGRIDRKVDADKVQELAAEHGLEGHLGTLFRWKPELNVSVWKSTDDTITQALAGAITSKPGRPSFKVTVKEI